MWPLKETCGLLAPESIISVQFHHKQQAVVLKWIPYRYNRHTWICFQWQGEKYKISSAFIRNVCNFKNPSLQSLLETFMISFTLIRRTSLTLGCQQQTNKQNQNKKTSQTLDCLGSENIKREDSFVINLNQPKLNGVFQGFRLGSDSQCAM